MTARTIDTNKLVSGYTSQGWYNGRKATTVRQRVIPTNGALSSVLNYQLPARARIVWAEMLVNSAISVTGSGAGGSTNTADSFALIMSPVTGTVSAALTAPITNTVAFSSLSGGTNGFIVLQGNGLTTAASSQQRGTPVLKGTTETNQHVNTATVGACLSLMPISTSGVGSTTCVFGTSTSTSTATVGSIDVTLYVEEYEQAPYGN